MKQQDLWLDKPLRHALEVRARCGVPADVDVWPRVERAISAQSRIGSGEHHAPSVGRRIIVALVVCVTLLMSGVAVAAAASPSLRHLLQEVVVGIPAGHAGAGTDAHGLPYQIQPLPPFTLYYPTSQPDRLFIRGTGQLHPRYGANGFGIGSFCPDPPAVCPDIGTHPATVFVPPHPTDGLPSLLIPFDGAATDVVWFGSHGVPPDQRFIQIVEWDSAMSPPKSISAAGIPSLDPGASETLLVVTRGATTIAIDTNVGASETQRVADSLQPLNLSAR